MELENPARTDASVVRSSVASSSTIDYGLPVVGVPTQAPGAVDVLTILDTPSTRIGTCGTWVQGGGPGGGPIFSKRYTLSPRYDTGRYGTVLDCSVTSESYQKFIMYNGTSS